MQTHVLGLVAVAVLVVGCSESMVAEPDPDPELTLAVSHGARQTGVVQQPLVDQIEVTVREVGSGPSQPAAGIEVCFDAATGGAGHPSARCVESGASGRAATSWVLGTVAGDHTITAEADDVGSVDFEVTALPGELAELDAELTLPSSRMREGSTLDLSDWLEIERGYDRWSNEIEAGVAADAVLALPDGAVRWELVDASSSAIGSAGWGWSFEPPDPAVYEFVATGRVSLTCDGELRSDEDEAAGVPGVELHEYRVRILLTLTLDGRANTVSSSEGAIQTPSDAVQAEECGHVVYSKAPTDPRR